MRKKQRDTSASSRVLAKNKVNLSQHSKGSKTAAKTATSYKQKMEVPVFSAKVCMVGKWINVVLVFLNG